MVYRQLFVNFSINAGSAGWDNITDDGRTTDGRRRLSTFHLAQLDKDKPN